MHDVDSPEPVAALADAVIRCLSDDFHKHGTQLVVELREKDPKGYLGLILRLVPSAATGSGLVVHSLLDLRGFDGR